MRQVRELVEYPLTHPEIYVHLGVEPPRGLLLHGPPGCGKTLLACSIAQELGVTFLRISAPEVVSGMSGESEAKIRQLLIIITELLIIIMSGESEAKIRQLFKEAADQAPALIFIDEIDAIAPKRETAQREMERRIVAQLLTCMVRRAGALDDAARRGWRRGSARLADDGGRLSQDELNFAATGGQTVIVVGATNRPDSIDPALRRAGRFDREIIIKVSVIIIKVPVIIIKVSALRRAGRFDREIALGIPDNESRARILAVLCKCMRLSGDLDLAELVSTHHSTLMTDDYS
jgi:ribosome biogenesis ATPase